MAKEAIGGQGREIFDHIMGLGSLAKSLKREVCQIVVQNAIPFPRGAYQHPLERRENGKIPTEEQLAAELEEDLEESSEPATAAAS